MALKTYASGPVTVIETLSSYTHDITCVNRNRILSWLFWVFQPCIKGFVICKPIIQIEGIWFYVKYKGTLLMVVAQDNNNIIFPTAFALVDGETGHG